jgi:hypothetical protein
MILFFKGFYMNEDTNIKLAIGLGSPLTVQIEGMEERFKATLIGMQPRVFLIIRMQIASNFRTQLDTGTSLIIRYLFMGNVYGFRSQYLGSTTFPFKTSFIAYPESIESLNLRNAQRVNSFIPATAHINNMELRGIITDISTDGTRFKINTAESLSSIEVDDQVDMLFPLFGIEGSQRFKGKIRNINRDTESFSFGIKFTTLDTKVIDIINNYVTDVIDYIE